MEKIKTYTSAKQAETSVLLFLLPIALVTLSFKIWPQIYDDIPNMSMLFFPVLAMSLFLSKNYKHVCRNITSAFVVLEPTEEERKTKSENLKKHLDQLVKERDHLRSHLEEALRLNDSNSIKCYSLNLERHNNHITEFLKQTGLKIEIREPIIKKDYSLSPNCYGCGSNDWKHNKCSYCGGTH